MPHPKGHMKLSGDIHPPELEWDDADIVDAPRRADTKRAAKPALDADVAIIASPRLERPFWHRDRAPALIAAAGLAAVVLSLLAGRRRAH
jgi:hypothetical protein